MNQQLWAAQRTARNILHASARCVWSRVRHRIKSTLATIKRIPCWWIPSVVTLFGAQIVVGLVSVETNHDALIALTDENAARDVAHESVHLLRKHLTSALGKFWTNATLDARERNNCVDIRPQNSSAVLKIRPELLFRLRFYLFWRCKIAFLLKQHEREEAESQSCTHIALPRAGAILPHLSTLVRFLIYGIFSFGNLRFVRIPEFRWLQL